MDGLTDTLSTWWNNAVNAVESIPDEWNAKIAQLKSAVSDFEKTYAALQSQKSIAQKDPVLYADYTAIMERGNYVKTVITDTLSKLGSALNYVKNTVGMSGMGDLGALPLIPIAVIAGALALISKWLTDAYAMNKKLNLLDKTYNDAKAAGASPQQLQAIAHDAALQNTGGLFNGAGGVLDKAIVILIIGGALYLLAPTIKKALSRGRP